MPDTDFELGRTALLEITSAGSIGANVGSVDEGDGVSTVYFETMLSGYPGWRWTVSIAHVDGIAPSVLETELTPGDGALLSPEWVPWVDRLADYSAAQDGAGEEPDDESDGDESDDDDDDFDSDVLHGGDVDGVDIDEQDSGFPAPDDGIGETDGANNQTDDNGPEDRSSKKFSQENEEYEKSY